MTEKSPEFTIIIEPNRVQKEYFKDLFRYRELLYFLVWKEIIVRYKQAALGIAWAIIKPLITLAIFAFIFSKITPSFSDNVSYPLFVLVGLLPWLLFASSMNDASHSLVNNTHLISKVYFPRFIIVLSSILVNTFDFFIGFALLFLIFLLAGSLSLSTVIFLPFFLVLHLFLCLAIGLWVSSLTVRYRDLKFIIQFIIQFGLFISPVGYSALTISSSWKYLLFLNPVEGIIDGFRWSIFGIYHPDLMLSITCSIVVTGLLLISGFSYFRKTERNLADVI